MFSIKSLLLIVIVAGITAAVSGADSFYRLNTPIAPKWIKSVSVDSAGVLYVVESMSILDSSGYYSSEPRPDTVNRIFYSGDLGNSWHPVPTPFMSQSMNRGSWGGPVVTSKGAIFDVDFGATFSQSVFRSVDKGHNWEEVLPGLGIDGASLFKVTALDYIIFKSAYWSFPRYFFSKDNGVTWAQFDTTTKYQFGTPGSAGDQAPQDFAISEGGTFLFSSWKELPCAFYYNNMCLESGGSVLEKHMSRDDSVFTFNSNLQCFSTGRSHTVFLGTATGTVISRDDGRNWATVATGNIKEIIPGQGNVVFIKKDGEGVFARPFDGPDDTTGWIFCGLKDSLYRSLCSDRDNEFYFLTDAGLFSTRQPTSVIRTINIRKESVKFSIDRRAVVFAHPFSTPVTIEIYDIAGKRLPLTNSGLLAPGLIRLTLPSLRPGFYLVRCGTNGSSFIGRFFVL